ncbi:hypothetical protein RQP46_002041 [Phenoliferia psychrophenolica]
MAEEGSSKRPAEGVTEGGGSASSVTPAKRQKTEPSTRATDADSRTWGGRSDNAPDGKKRTWGPQSDAPATLGEGEEKKERFPKKKVAVLIGYNGGGYKGSQINPAVDTIEGEVFKAFVKAGAVSEDNSNNYQKVGLSRAARTDAGVHAAINVLSIKLILEPPSLPASTTLEAHVNSFLPPTIRIWSVLRVQGSFNPRMLCDQRRYEYTVPTHVFLGPKPKSPMANWLEKARATPAPSVSSSTTTTDPVPTPDVVLPTPEPTTPTKEAMNASAAFWAAQPDGTAFLADVAAKRDWRIPPGLLKDVRAFFEAYEGSHNFYNYTVGKDFRDRSCQRVMRKMEVSEPFIVNNTEYVSVTFLGQSFMLHQIRKMIGLAILSIRSSTPPSLIAETFGPSHIHVPKAPALGLLLLEPQYGEYNKRVDESNLKLVSLVANERISESDRVEQTRDHMDYKGLEEKVDAFKKEEVYKNMWEIEEADAVFSRWLNWLDVYTGPDFEYLNPNGTIPAVATFKKGENPEAFKVQPIVVADATAVVEDILPASDDEGVAAGQEDG